MNPLVKVFEKKQIEALNVNLSDKNFKVGDTVKVQLVVQEKGKKWVQTTEGVCISISKKGIASSYTIRRIDKACAITVSFPLYHPDVTCEVLKRGKVRRAKLYYLERTSNKKGEIKSILPQKKVLK